MTFGLLLCTLTSSFPPVFNCHTQSLFLPCSAVCSVLRWETGKAPNPSTSSRPRILTGMMCHWRNTGNVCVGTTVTSWTMWVTMFMPYVTSIKSHARSSTMCLWFSSLLSNRGNVCVIVNVASKWGKTRVNYTQLVEMHASYAEKGLRILGFPCNQFGGQVRSRPLNF